MGFLARLKTLSRVMRRRKRPLEAMALLRRRPALMAGVNFFEMTQLASGTVPMRLKALASVKTSSLIGCPF